jgi:hypothetical protein
LYSTAPVGLVTLQLIIVESPLHIIVLAVAVTPKLHPAKTSIVEVAELSVVRSPATEVPAAQLVPFPKFIFPANDCAGETVTPCAFSIIMRTSTNRDRVCRITKSYLRTRVC